MAREKLATQVDAELLSAVRALAKTEGREVHSLVDEALADLVEKRHQDHPRRHDMATYDASHARYAPLYKTLAE